MGEPHGQTAPLLAQAPLALRQRQAEQSSAESCRSASLYSAQFVPRRFGRGMWWRRSALYLCGMKARSERQEQPPPMRVRPSVQHLWTAPALQELLGPLRHREPVSAILFGLFVQSAGILALMRSADRHPITLPSSSARCCTRVGPEGPTMRNRTVEYFLHYPGIGSQAATERSRIRFRNQHGDWKRLPVRLDVGTAECPEIRPATAAPPPTPVFPAL